jgi:predicted dehydrogenase
MRSKRLGVAVIGTGGIGEFHVRLWNETPGAEVVGVFDRDAEVAQQVARQHGVERVFASLEEAIASPAEAIDICTPNRFHAEGVLAALEAGKHCLCEKPLAPSAGEIEKLIAARERNGTVLMTAHQLRFEQRTRTLKRLIDAGRLGEVYYTRAWWLRRRMVPSSPGLLTSELAVGGPGMDLGVHMLDLAFYLLGHPRPVAVSGYATRRLAQRTDSPRVNEWGVYDARLYDVEDFVTGFVRFDDDTVLSLEASWLLNMAESEVVSVALHGTEGGIRWPDLELAHVQDDVLVDARLASGRGKDGYAGEMRAFVEAVQRGGPSPVPPEESLVVARVLDALYASAGQGREVVLG